MTPRGDIFASRKLKAAGMVPSANKRLPLPSVIGKSFNHNSSTRSCESSVWIRFALPWTCNSGPSCCLSLVISWTTSPERSVELLQLSERRVCEATYFFPSGQRCRLSSNGPAFFEGNEQSLALVTKAKARELLALSTAGLLS